VKRGVSGASGPTKSAAPPAPARSRGQARVDSAGRRAPAEAMQNRAHLSLLVAFVVSLASVACGDDAADGAGPLGIAGEGGTSGKGGKGGKGGTGGKGGDGAGGAANEDGGNGGSATSGKGGKGGSNGGADAGGSETGGTDAGGANAGGGKGGSSAGGGKGGSSLGGSGGSGAGGALTCQNGLSDTACGTCAKTTCCSEAEACFADTACLACLDGDGSQCTGAVLAALDTCLNDGCATACAPPPECTDGGSPYTGAKACDDCVSAVQKAGGCCDAEIGTCSENADCSALIDCINPCPSSACVQACAAQFPNGVGDYVAAADCIFGDDTAGSVGACGTVCANTGGTGGAGGGGGAAGTGGAAGAAGTGGAAGAAGAGGAAGAAGAGGAAGTGGAAGAAGAGGAPSCQGALIENFCGLCLENNCCAETDACLADADCSACLDGDDTKCKGPVLTAFDACATASCDKPCTPVADCGATPVKPSNAACGAAYTCNPIGGVNAGGAAKECAAGSACDYDGAAFGCYPPPNTIALCGACNNQSTFCADGLTCVGGQCTRFCCDDGDCGANGLCDAPPGDVGNCVAK
jgi:hypothetical protein